MSTVRRRNRIRTRTRKALNAAGWREYQFTGSKSKCCVCFQPFEPNEWIWGGGSTYHGYYHGVCLGGIFQYAPIVFEAAELYLSDKMEMTRVLARSIAEEIGILKRDVLPREDEDAEAIH